MAIIPQICLFEWDELAELGDLERLRLVLEYLPDESLMRKLETERGNGRDDYPVRGVWNSILAGIVYQHGSIASLRRELDRNAQLRMMCGLGSAVPTASAYTRFFSNLYRHSDEVDAIFECLVEKIKELLPEYGKRLAMDGKAIKTHARPRKKNEDELGEPDGRGDSDARWGAKAYWVEHKDGSKEKKVDWWFGYKLHLIVDADYELPVAFELTKAPEAEVVTGKKLIDGLNEAHPEILDRCEYLSADKGYDDTKLLARLWDQHQVKPVIAIRNLWQDGEDTRLIEGQTNVVYDHRGKVYCHCPKTDTRREMTFGGFEKDRGTLKYLCPTRHYGLKCKGCDECPLTSGMLRIRLSEDRRVFTPVARSSHKWKREYRNRTAAERVNSRLDVSFGFENHFIRGQRKMHLRCGLALSVMLAMAAGRVKEKREDLMRSLVKTVA